MPAMTREELRALLVEASPEFLRMVEAREVDQIIMHAVSYNEAEEMILLGVQIKYATLQGLHVTVLPEKP